MCKTLDKLYILIHIGVHGGRNYINYMVCLKREDPELKPDTSLLKLITLKEHMS